MYAFAQGPASKKATLVFRFEDPDAAIKALGARGGWHAHGRRE